MADRKENVAIDETVETEEKKDPVWDEPVEAAEAQESAETNEAETSPEETETAPDDTATTEEAETAVDDEVQDGEFVEAEDEPGQRKGFFGKKKDKKDKKDIQIEELTDQVRRQMAEFDNFRKRTEKEKSAMYEIGAKSVVEKILPVVDNFERGLAGVDENTEDPFTEGMQKIYKQLMSTLESIGVKPIEAAGQEFNPDFHNAVMHVEDEELGENIVVEELQKGYMYRDSVVRHSMVKVAN